MDVLHLSSSVFQSLEPINIESLILRFAEQMNFGRMKQRIANEAVRIVQRMSRDWMTDGRRPAGICGAALILAARMNNFRRVVREVVYTVKVAEVTILKRLDEFSQTASSRLTVEEFRTKDLERAEDPPAFKNRDKVKKKRGRRKKDHLIEAHDNATEEGSERASSAIPLDANDQLRTPANTQAQRDRQSMPPPPIPIDPALLRDSNQRSAVFRQSPSPSSTGTSPLKRGRGRPPGKNQPSAPPSTGDLQLEARIEADIENILGNEANVRNAEDVHQNPDARGIPSTGQRVSEPPVTLRTQSTSALIDVNNPPPPVGTQPESEQQSQDRIDPHSPPQTQETLDQQSLQRSLSPLPLTQQHTTKARQLITSTSTTQPLLDSIPSTLIIPDSEFASDPEIENCLLTPSEIAIKERIWVHENSQYLRAQQSKLLKQQLAEQNGTARVIVKRRRRRTRMGDLKGIYSSREGEGGEEVVEAPKDAAEAVERMMRKRGFSRKINYGMIGSAYEGSSKGGSSERSSSEIAENSRKGSLVPSMETSLSPGGEIVVEGEPGRKGESREEAIEVEDDGEESVDDDYYTENEDMEMAGVDEVLGRIGEDDEEEAEDEEEDEDDD